MIYKVGIFKLGFMELREMLFCNSYKNEFRKKNQIVLFSLLTACMAIFCKAALEQYPL